MAGALRVVKFLVQTADGKHLIRFLRFLWRSVNPVHSHTRDHN